MTASALDFHPPQPKHNEDWLVRSLINERGDRVDLSTKYLGAGSSRQPEHNHPEGKWPRKGEKRCSACRWFEVQLYKTREGYAVQQRGCSVVPGERTYHRLWQTPSAFHVVEIMTVRENSAEHKRAFLPQPSAHLLAVAAEFDDAIREAYVNRAVP